MLSISLVSIVCVLYNVCVMARVSVPQLYPNSHTKATQSAHWSQHTALLAITQDDWSHRSISNDCNNCPQGTPVWIKSCQV